MYEMAWIFVVLLIAIILIISMVWVQYNKKMKRLIDAAGALERIKARIENNKKYNELERKVFTAKSIDDLVRLEKKLARGVINARHSSLVDCANGANGKSRK